MRDLLLPLVRAHARPASFEYAAWLSTEFGAPLTALYVIQAFLDGPVVDSPAVLSDAIEHIREQRRAGPYYLGSRLSAVDIYSATFMGMFMPLPESQCAMHPAARAAFEWVDEETLAAIDPLLMEHRDMMYSRHLDLPLSL